MKSRTMNGRFIEKRNRYILTKFSKLLDVILSRVVGSNQELFGPMEKTVSNKYFNDILRERMFQTIAYSIDETSGASTFEEVLHLTITKHKLLNVVHLNSLLYTVEMDEHGTILSSNDLTEYIAKVGATVKAYRDVVRGINAKVKELEVRYTEITTKDFTDMRISYFHVDNDVDELVTKGILVGNENTVIKELSYDDLSINVVLEHIMNTDGIVGRKLKEMNDGRITYLYEKYIRDMSFITKDNLLKPRTKSDVIACLDVILILTSMENMDNVGTVSTLGKVYDDVFKDNKSALINAYNEFVELNDNAGDNNIIGYSNKNTVDIFTAKANGEDFNIKRVLGLAINHSGVIVDGMLLERHEKDWDERVALHNLKAKRYREARFKDLIKAGVVEMIDGLDEDTKLLFDNSSLTDTLNWFYIDTNDVGNYFMEIINNLLHSYGGINLEPFHDAFKILSEPDNKLTIESIVVLATNTLVVGNLLFGIRVIDIAPIKG